MLLCCSYYHLVPTTLRRKNNKKHYFFSGNFLILHAHYGLLETRTLLALITRHSNFSWLIKHLFVLSPLFSLVLDYFHILKCRYWSLSANSYTIEQCFTSGLCPGLLICDWHAIFGTHLKYGFFGYMHIGIRDERSILSYKKCRTFLGLFSYGWIQRCWKSWDFLVLANQSNLYGFKQASITM